MPQILPQAETYVVERAGVLLHSTANGYYCDRSALYSDPNSEILEEKDR